MKNNKVGGYYHRPSVQANLPFAVFRRDILYVCPKPRLCWCGQTLNSISGIEPTPQEPTLPSVGVTSYCCSEFFLLLRRSLGADASKRRSNLRLLFGVFQLLRHFRSRRFQASDFLETIVQSFFSYSDALGADASKRRSNLILLFEVFQLLRRSEASAPIGVNF